MITKEKQKKIIHVDMDAFFASVEQMDAPSLKGKPVVVGGDPLKRGVVASASYEARSFGIKSAMPSSMAKKLCPEVVFIRPHFDRYKEISSRIRKIFFEITDLVEPLSLDEAYLDVTENKLNEPSATRLANYLRSRIKGSVGLTASAGVSSLKFVAKIASDINKPNGLKVIPPSEVDDFIKKLPVEKLWGVGPATASKLHKMGIKTVIDIRKQDKFEFEKMLGEHGRFIYGLAHGRDDREVVTEHISKSKGMEETFEKDIVDVGYLAQVVSNQIKKVSERLKKGGFRGRTVTLKIRYNDFKTITRSVTLNSFTDDHITFKEVAINLLNTVSEAGKRPVRLIGITVSGFDNSRVAQLEIPFVK